MCVQTAFFGSGNIASISSFHLSSTFVRARVACRCRTTPTLLSVPRRFRFVSVFAPHVMAVLLVIKLLVPHVVVGCCFATTDWRAQGSSLLAAPFTLRVTAFTSSWALHLLLQVRSEGSWKEIGNSVSACIVAAGTCVLVSLVSVVSALLLHVGRLPLDTAVEQTDIRGCTSDNSEKTA
jgi:phosphatidylinositol glycan class N